MNNGKKRKATEWLDVAGIGYEALPGIKKGEQNGQARVTMAGSLRRNRGSYSPSD